MIDIPKTAPPVTDLTGLSEAERSLALKRFQMLRPFLEEQIPLREVALNGGISVRTAGYWAQRYRKEGFVGLARKTRHDKAKPKIPVQFLELIEGLALRKPQLSGAAIHRQVAEFARNQGQKPPSYSFVYAAIRRIHPSLVTLAQEGSKVYSESFDLIHRREAEAPNAIWQADHSELDIFVRVEKGEAKKPWLTIVLDDYSRAVAGFMLFFGAPSAIQTALALRLVVGAQNGPIPGARMGAQNRPTPASSVPIGPVARGT